MQETAGVGELRVEIIAGAATLTQIIEIYCLDIRDELRVEDLINTAAMLIQDMAFRLLPVRVPVRLETNVSKRRRALGMG